MVKWYYITTPRWTVAIKTEGGKVVHAPPIARWMIGKYYPQVIYDIRANTIRWHELSEEVIGRINETL